MSNQTPEKMVEVGEKLIAAGDAAKALRVLTSVAAKRPDDPRIQYDLGLAYSVQGVPDEAVQHFNRAVAKKPDYSEAYNALGAVYADLGKSAEAEYAFGRALANPQYTTPYFSYYNLGQLAEKQGDPERALAKYREAVRLNAAYSPAHYRMGAIYEAGRRMAEARDAYALAIRTDPENIEAQFAYGRLSYAAGDREAAYTAFSTVVRASPKSEMGLTAAKYLEMMDPSRKEEGRSSERSPAPTRATRQGIASLQAEIDQRLRETDPGEGGRQVVAQAPQAAQAFQSSQTSQASQAPLVIQSPPSPAPQATTRASGSSASAAGGAQNRAAPPETVADGAAEPPRQKGKTATPISIASTPSGASSSSGAPQPSGASQPKAAAPRPAPDGMAPAKAPAPANGASGPAGASGPGIAKASSAPKPASPPTGSGDEAARTPVPGESGDAPAAGGKGAYVVQAFSYRSEDNARRMLDALKAKGWSATVKKQTNASFGSLYVIQLAPVTSAEEAKALMIRLEREEKVKPLLVKLPGH
jgi:tetratricopeptide (TPR) repeat protein